MLSSNKLYRSDKTQLSVKPTKARGFLSTQPITKGYNKHPERSLSDSIFIRAKHASGRKINISMESKPKHIIVGMSGGVDSSVAAHLLLEQGHKVTGLFMKNWEEDDDKEYCAAAEDLADAQAVSDRLGIELRTVNFASEYWDNVFEYFLEEYRAGRTPNPDIMCNKEIKFKAFLDFALSLGADYIATGHYVRKTLNNGSYELCKGKDENKDQSYFLYTLGQEQLKHSLFPLGELHKDQVRELAAQAGFINHKKKDSTGICFIGERKFSDFLNRFLPAQPGDIVTPTGDIIGQHQGLMFHTIGQRQGLGIGGVANAKDEPWFVVEKDLEQNHLIVTQGHQHPLLMHQQLIASQLTWVAGQAPQLPLTCFAKNRYRQSDQACSISSLGNGLITVDFSEPQRAITPGQSVVFYNNDVCLGGGIIEQRNLCQNDLAATATTESRP